MGRKQGVFIHSEKIECKTCKKWFVSEEKKKEHLALHQSCPYPGCTFSAIEKVLSAHIASVHEKKAGTIPPSLLELIPEKCLFCSSVTVDTVMPPRWATIPRTSKSVSSAGMTHRWREERRKRYPTQSNLEKKEAAEKAREISGGLE